MKTVTIILLCLLCSHSILPAQELNTILMESTFKIVGKTKVDTLASVGTVFFIVRPYTDTARQGRVMLVTAAHVLEAIAADNAIVFFRKKVGPNTYVNTPTLFQIRDHGKPLWMHHHDPSVDIAAMKAGIPSGMNVAFLSTRDLATDSTLNKYEIHPGDEVFTLGYPFGIDANAEGFPILRSGKIASYPLTPSSSTRRFLLDMNIYEGNSGGPAYASYNGRVYGNMIHMESVNFVVGVVSEQAFSSPTHGTALQIGVIVPSQFIVETLDQIK